MKYFLCIIIFLLISACQSKLKEIKQESLGAAAQTDTCKINSPSFKWQLSYCTWVTNTHDKTATKFQSCLNRDNSKTENLNECQKRNYFKNKYCEHKISLDYIKEGIHTCMNNKNYEGLWLKNLKH